MDPQRSYSQASSTHVMQLKRFKGTLASCLWYRINRLNSKYNTVRILGHAMRYDEYPWIRAYSGPNARASLHHHRA